MNFYKLVPGWLKKKWHREYKMKAQHAFNMGRPEDIIEYTTKCLNIEDKDYAALNLRGLGYYDLQEWELAMKDFNAAIALEPERSPAICNKGLLRLKEKDYPSALKHFEYALTLEKNDFTIYNNLGFCKSLMGSYAEAIRDLDKAILLDRNFAYAYNNRGFAKMQLGDLTGAQQDITRSLELDTLNSYAYKNKGLLYLEHDRIDKALIQFYKARDLGYADKYDNEVEELIAKYGFDNDNRRGVY